jgi:amino-acid N-acetyltransferase
MRDLTLQQADESSIGYVERLLERADLPTDGVRAHPERFYIARHRDARVGVGGLELYGAVGLLRSVAVERSVRGRGYGTDLCDSLEGRACDSGAESLYLLTTTAEAFFGDRGYEEIERPAVPDAIRETAEFAELCPSTATVLRKSL